ncbi:hypothetical protein B0680_00925 [Moraxella pluranimalium]|uniref:HTH tetR-type domain-containing protein n=1 Tax=Moraxella pluranimalium TaxID=470453 RepID=A0A1T0CUJ8_9GAMM|nr:hypothetical protein B0680_00925 [Moraxella pluranimalium]
MARDTTPKKRKNNPEQLRHLLINAAKDLMIKDGIANLSMQKVADAAGTSKGGLFHHFKSKEELIAAVIGLFIAQLNTAILAHIGVNHSYGVFTRAYVSVFFDNDAIGLQSDWAGLIRSINSDAIMQSQWQDWMNQKLRQFADTDSDAKLAIVRYAVDGAWLDETLTDDNERYQAVKAELIGMIV